MCRRAMYMPDEIVMWFLLLFLRYPLFEIGLELVRSSHGLGVTYIDLMRLS